MLYEYKVFDWACYEVIIMRKWFMELEFDDMRDLELFEWYGDDKFHVFPIYPVEIALYE